MNKLQKKLRRIWLIIKNRLWGTPVPLETIYLDELPDQLKKDIVYLIGENGYLWVAALLCPCGCQAVIQLNLLTDVKPCWHVEEYFDGTVSLAPSVWSRRGCGSHYFVRQGFIKWHNEK
jgi:hypothetical protein